MPSELRTIALFSSKRFLISLAIHIKKEGNEEMLKMDETRVRISGLCGRLFTCHMERPYETSEKKMLVAQSCPTLCNPMDYNPPGSSVHGILKASIVDWLAIPFSRRSSWPRNRPRSPALQADSLPSEPPGKSTKNLQFKKVMLCQWRKYFGEG